MNIDYEAIGRRIRTRWIQKAMTREQLAALIEREPAYLSRIEHGNQKPMWVFLKSEKCGRGGKSERKKVEKGGKGRESAVFNEG